MSEEVRARLNVLRGKKRNDEFIALFEEHRA
jgi:hypothetical protein